VRRPEEVIVLAVDPGPERSRRPTDLPSGSVVRRGRLVARIAVAASVIGAVAGLVLVQRAADTYDEALGVTVEAARIGGEAADPVSGLAAQVAALGRVAVVGLDDAGQLVDTGAGTAAALSLVLGDDVALAVDGTQRIADRVAGVLETIERLVPGDTESAAEDLRDLADGLAPVPGDLRDLGDELSAVADDLASASRTLAAAGVALDAATADLDEVVAGTTELPELFAELERSAGAARDDLGTDRWWWRIAVVTAATAVAALALAVDRALAALAPVEAP
jgi:hypothetical protein